MSTLNMKQKKNRIIKLSQYEKELLVNKIEQRGANILLLGVILTFIFLR